jgi:hypothetical protein
MAFALFRNESYQRINIPIRTNMQRFCLARAAHDHTEGCSSPRNPIRATLNTHTDMLSEILAAATEEPDEESGIAKTLARIFLALETQNENLVRIGGLLTNIGGTVENAVVRGVQRAVNDADGDGVVEE